MKLYFQKLEAASLEMDQILQQWKPNTIMYVNESIQTTRDAKNSEKSNLSSEKKATSAALNDLVAFVNKRVIGKKHTNGCISVVTEVQNSIHY